NRTLTVLFACRDNSGPSLLAEALANHTQPSVRAFSAGLDAETPVDLAAVECLHLEKIPADGLSAKPLELFSLIGAPRVDVIISLLGSKQEALHSEIERFAQRCRGARLHRWHFEDIARIGDMHDRRLAYRQMLSRLRTAVGALGAGTPMETHLSAA
ncbi:MAG: hypothetical protein B7Z45_06600, partial [Azorhizobium sp. 12-66-6]